MHDDVRNALKAAIVSGLALLDGIASERAYTERILVWKSSGSRAWTGEYIDRPHIDARLAALSAPLESIRTQFSTVFLSHYPQYQGLIGLDGLGMSMHVDPESILLRAIRTAWERCGTTPGNEELVNAAVQEIADAVDSAEVEFQYLAPLTNFNTNAQRIDLPEGMVIRQLTGEEVTDFYGGPVDRMAHARQLWRGIHDFVIEGTVRTRLVFGPMEVTGAPLQDEIRRKIERAVLALVVFKGGVVDYEMIRWFSAPYSPAANYVLTTSSANTVPFGTYELHNDELQFFQETASRVFSISDVAMEIACSRLMDAQARYRAQDKVLDAVIGLEALLLAAVPDRGELKNRFSLNYSTLASSAEDRYRDYAIAGDLYDHRSSIAHGSPPKHLYRLGQEKVQIEQVADHACEALRRVIKYFLEHPLANPHEKEFWEKRYFGLA